ncbi:MAG TPA: hypothetical protein VGI39_01415 [Polyangiaceae bacterium]|jgi:hypothetical protein
MSKAPGAPKERPLIFSAPMVNAILAGTKTQTRRLVKPLQARIAPRVAASDLGAYFWLPPLGRKSGGWIECPYGFQGQHLRVKETWAPHADEERHFKAARPWSASICYRADGAFWDNDDGRGGRGWYVPGGDPHINRWRSPLFLPRWASRLMLEITSIRIERLKEISEEDARAEGYGVAFGPGMFARSFPSYWDSINAEKAPWSSNPRVWVIGFRKLP